MKAFDQFLRLLAAPLVLAATVRAAEFELGAELENWLKNRPGGASLAHVTPAGVAFHQAGAATPGNPAAPTPDTLWEIGSVTKVFTGILLARSETAGKASRGDSAAMFLLDSEEGNAGKITLEHLTTHTSGLPRLPSNLKLRLLLPWNCDNPYSTYTGADLLEGLRKDGAGARIGGPVDYSNFGVSVLGEALARAWGASYAEVLGEQVLEPLELEHTTLALAGGEVPPGMAPALVVGKTIPRWTFQSMAPAGALRSSTRDLALFLQACMGLRETSLRDAIAESMKPLKPTDDMPGSIGMGWFITGDEGEDSVIWHNGATGGFQSFLGFSPRRREGVVILTNSSKDPTRFGFDILRRGGGE